MKIYPIKQSVAELLQALIQIPSVNPPGNEIYMAKFLSEIFDEHGIENRILKSEPNRGNIIARIQGNQPGKKLLLLGHLDVVPAKDASEWKYPPFDGVIKDGYVWGRGALDMKGGIAMQVITMLLVKENINNFKGELIFAGTADEEMGGYRGMKWLVDHHPNLINADYVITEGGGIPLKNSNERCLYLVENAEKGMYWLNIKAKGQTAHGSIPAAGDNAIAKICDIINAISNNNNKRILHPIVIEFLTNVLKHKYGIKGSAISLLLHNKKMLSIMIRNSIKKAPALGTMLDALTRNSLTPTIIKGGAKENIIPNSCELVLDCRLLPGYDEKDILKMFYKMGINLDDFEIKFLRKEEASFSPTDTELWRTIESVIKQEVNNANIAPYMIPGATDSRFIRKLGAVSYGFLPFHPDVNADDMVSRIHGKDERIDIKSLVFGTKILYEVAVKILKMKQIENINQVFQTDTLLSSPIQH